MTRPAHFTVDATDGRARAGRLVLPGGVVETPVFMPVGTAGTVKGVSPEELAAAGASMVLANTYHLYVRPGAEVVGELGGVHDFMRWQRPILTDSGGYQVFSLASTRDIDDDGVTFRNHIDGTGHRFTPESVIDVQRQLGADVIMAFDECPPGGVPRDRAALANRRTTAWLERCRARFDATHGAAPRPQTLFPVLQGNVYDDLRAEQVEAALAMGDWAGFGIGGLSVGEAKGDMWRTVELLDGLIPSDRPRYLMGVGYPDDLLEAIARGCDMFDCVAPTRNARHGTAWTLDEGQINLRGRPFPPRPRPHRPHLRLLRLPRLRSRVHPSPACPGRTFRPPPRLHPQPALPPGDCPRFTAAYPRRYLYRVGTFVARSLPRRPDPAHRPLTSHTQDADPCHSSPA